MASTRRKCRYCKKMFSTAQGRSGHERFVHRGENPKKKGSKSTSSIIRFRSLRREKAEDRRKPRTGDYPCDVCGVGLSSKWYKKVHEIKIHGNMIVPKKQSLKVVPKGDGGFCPFCGHALYKHKAARYCAFCGKDVRDVVVALDVIGVAKG